MDNMSQHWVTLTGLDPEVEMKVYKEEIMCGLREKSLSFPNLDKETTVNAMVNTDTMRSNPMIRQTPETKPPPMVNEVLGQHQNLSNTKKDDKAKTFEISDSESLALASTDSGTLTGIGVDYIDIAKYDKLAIFLEARVEEL
ncbi:hypothetical protein RJT34_07170 [Clitoria ternatea]|uniref:Uncharacterized protein n=1 Tax=Clitoria ternatea TaxID=43366 RepID=A0AAN9K4U1_CLITE